jgi:hypothetical protein
MHAQEGTFQRQKKKTTIDYKEKHMKAPKPQTHSHAHSKFDILLLCACTCEEEDGFDEGVQRELPPSMMISACQRTPTCPL